MEQLQELLNNESIVAEINSTQRLSKTALIEKCQTMNIEMKGLKNKHDYAVRIVATQHGWKDAKEPKNNKTRSSLPLTAEKKKVMECKKQEPLILEMLPVNILEYVNKNADWHFRVCREKDAWCPENGLIFSFKTRQVLGKWDKKKNCLENLTCEDMEMCKEKKLPYSIPSEIQDVPSFLAEDKGYRERIAEYIRGGPSTVVEELQEEEEEEIGESLF